MRGVKPQVLFRNKPREVLSVTEQEAIEKIHSVYPTGTKNGLENMRSLMEKLGNPQERLTMVHVAGTNGKGSCCAMIERVLRAAGCHTGLYIEVYNERIRLDGVPISGEKLAALVEKVWHAVQDCEKEDVHVTEFELGTALAFTCFAEEKVDVAVIEVGLGGRLDSTNVVVPEVCAITSIALDHTHVLGDTIAKIAHEKAGIIKAGIPVVSYKQKPEAEAVIMQCAREVGAPVSVPRFGRIHAHAEGLHQVFSYDGFTDVRLKLAGTYQPNNAVMAIEIARVLRGRGFEISDEAIKAGLEATVWQGRFEVVRDNPTVIVDGVLAASLREYFPQGGVTFVMNVLRDKNYRAMIDATLPLAARYFCAEPPENERALHADELACAIRERELEFEGVHDYCVQRLQVQACPSIANAVEGAVEAAGPDGVVCCFGSLYAIADVMAALKGC